MRSSRSLLPQDPVGRSARWTRKIHHRSPRNIHASPRTCPQNPRQTSHRSALTPSGHPHRIHTPHPPFQMLNLHLPRASLRQPPCLRPKTHLRSLTLSATSITLSRSLLSQQFSCPCMVQSIVASVPRRFSATSSARTLSLTTPRLSKLSKPRSLLQLLRLLLPRLLLLKVMIL